MNTQNGNGSPQLRAKPSWREEGHAAPLYRAASPSRKRGACHPERGPTFLKVYVMPMLLLNLAVVGWTLVTRTFIAQGLLVSLGYALIVAAGFRLYLVYLDHYLFSASSVQSGRKVQLSTRDRDHDESERWQDARRTSAASGPQRRQPSQIQEGVLI
jgi:hypothetical protein